MSLLVCVIGVSHHNLVSKRIVGIHALDHEQALIELLCFLVTDEQLGRLVCVKGGYALPDPTDGVLLLLGLFVEELFVFNWVLGALSLIVSEQFTGHE